MNEELKARRIKMGYSKQEVAEKAGITPAYYSYFENGKRRMNYQIAIRISAVLKTTPDKLFLKFEKNRMKSVD